MHNYNYTIKLKLHLDNLKMHTIHLKCYISYVKSYILISTYILKMGTWHWQALPAVSKYTDIIL